MYTWEGQQYIARTSKHGRFFCNIRTTVGLPIVHNLSILLFMANVLSIGQPTHWAHGGWCSMGPMLPHSPHSGPWDLRGPMGRAGGHGALGPMCQGSNGASWAHGPHVVGPCDGAHGGHGRKSPWDLTRPGMDWWGAWGPTGTMQSMAPMELMAPCPPPWSPWPPLDHG